MDAKVTSTKTIERDLSRRHHRLTLTVRIGSQTLSIQEVIDDIMLQRGTFMADDAFRFAWRNMERAIIDDVTRSIRESFPWG